MIISPSIRSLKMRLKKAMMFLTNKSQYIGVIFLCSLLLIAFNKSQAAGLEEIRHSILCVSTVYGYIPDNQEKASIIAKATEIAREKGLKQVNILLNNKLNKSFSIIEDNQGNGFRFQKQKEFDATHVGENLTGIRVFGIVQFEADIEPGDNLISIDIFSDKMIYYQGDPITIYMESNQDIYGCLVDISPDKVCTQLLPNTFRKDSLFEAGQFAFPAQETDGGFAFTVEPPFGKERLTLYASDLPIGGILSDDETYEVFAQIRQIDSENLINNFQNRIFDHLEKTNPWASFSSAQFVEATQVLTSAPK